MAAPPVFFTLCRASLAPSIDDRLPEEYAAATNAVGQIASGEVISTAPVAAAIGLGRHGSIVLLRHRTVPPPSGNTVDQFDIIFLMLYDRLCHPLTASQPKTKRSPVKYALLAALVCTVGFIACSDDDSVVSSSPDSVNAAKMTISGGKAGGLVNKTRWYYPRVLEGDSGLGAQGGTLSKGTAGGFRGNHTENVDIGFTAMVITDEEQAMITEKLAMITEYYAEKEPDLFLILVGNKEKLVDDMSCNSHDQAVVEQMLWVGNPTFLHLAPKEAIAEGALNQKYADAPDNIKEAIDFVNQFSSNVGALSDDVETGRIAFNFTNEELGIVNGECQDLGVHQLGLFTKETEVVTAMNNAGYGVATWNGLPVYADSNCKNGYGFSRCYKPHPVCCKPE